MRMILSYAKSHIYDIHAAVVAVLTIIVMYYIKKPIKEEIVKYIDKMLKSKPKMSERRLVYIKRANFILIIIALALSVLFFAIFAMISPLIHFSVESAMMSGVFALAGYAFLNQIFYGVKR